MEEEAAFLLLPTDPERLQVSAGVVERAVVRELEAGVVVARVEGGRQLEAVGLVVTGEQGPSAVAATVEKPELDPPATRRLLDVLDAEADVIDPAQPDQAGRPSATIRSASSSGIASATWSVCAETCICSPGPARSTSHSSIVFVRRPIPEISTSTTSPGPHRPRVRRRAREDHVTGLERDQAAQVGELVGDREQEVVGRRLLHDRRR